MTKAKGPKKAPTTVKAVKPDVKVFIAHYKVSRNGRQAAIAAGYAAHSADQTASRLLRSAKVRAEVEQHRADAIAKVQEDTGITLERTLREIARSAYFDARRLFTTDGAPIPIQELDDDTASAIAGLEVVTERKRGESESITTVRKYKLAERRGYLDMLMKHLDGYEADNKGKTTPFAEALAGFMSKLHQSGGSKLPIRPPGPRTTTAPNAIQLQS